MRVGLIEAVWEGTDHWDPPAAGADVAKEIGYESVDLVTDPLDLTEAELDAAVEAATSGPLPVAAGICVALGITDFNPSVRRFHTERALRHVDFAARVGASNMLMVIGDYIWKKEVIPPEEQWGWAVENVRAVASHAESLGLEIALELEVYEYSYVNTIDEMVRFLDEVGVDAMKANVDLNHLWPRKIDPGEIGKLTGRIAHAHISDCDGVVYENWPPGRKNAPLGEYMDALVATGFDATMAVELMPAPDGEEPVAWVREGYEKTVELIEAAGAKLGAAQL
jgi:D-psicose/D-tagatose/L-ribulose 3-epimerase